VATTTTACRPSSSPATTRRFEQWPLVAYVNDVTTAMTQAKEAAADTDVMVQAPVQR
jgi:hypothetical protein